MSYFGTVVSVAQEAEQSVPKMVMLKAQVELARKKARESQDDLDRVKKELENANKANKQLLSEGIKMMKACKGMKATKNNMELAVGVKEPAGLQG